MNFLVSLVPWIADALVVFGVFIVTIGIYGIIRMPDTFTRLHAASKAVFLGVITLLLASTLTGEPSIIYRVILIAAFLILTTPVSAHVIGRAGYLRRYKMRAPHSVDESGSGLNQPEPGDRPGDHPGDRPGG